jgi:tRNA(Leu) C34 or U34 (ribose-2'-O)-methylase TrmL
MLLRQNRKRRPRGYAVVALVNPKSPHNIGGVLRAAGCYAASLVVLGGKRPIRLGSLITDTQKAWKHIPHIFVDDVFDALPYSCVPIAIDFWEDAKPLQSFIHPERAFYIFGPEDSTLGKEITNRCHHRVYIPTTHCMNLAATTNVVLYDRMAKQ